MAGGPDGGGGALALGQRCVLGRLPEPKRRLTPLSETGEMGYIYSMKNTPNWAHNSGKQKRTRGTCKGQLRARKQSLQSLKKQLNAK
jgi:hypothetical protein